MGIEEILNKSTSELKPSHLAELTLNELENLKAYEISGKNRKTVRLLIDSRMNALRKGITSGYGFIPDTIFKPRSYDGLRDKDWIRFGLAGDVHMINNYHDRGAWESYCADLVKDGIIQLFICGDLWDGCTSSIEVYPGHRMDVPIINYDKALDHIAKTCPDFNLKKDYITGNHDNKIYEKEGVNAGRDIESRRKQFDHDDFRFLQPYYARIELSTNPLVYLDMIHLRWGVPYTVGYAMQKYLRTVPPSLRAHIYGFGHTHHRQNVPIEEDHECFLVGGFQKPNSYSIRVGRGVTRGGWLIEGKLSDRSPSYPFGRFRAEFKRY